jgi:hypothetical protein
MFHSHTNADAPLTASATPLLQGNYCANEKRKCLTHRLGLRAFIGDWMVSPQSLLPDPDRRWLLPIEVKPGHDLGSREHFSWV